MANHEFLSGFDIVIRAVRRVTVLGILLFSREMLLTLDYNGPQVVHCFFPSGFSSQPIYASAMIATYNLFWTSLPTIAFALLEQDITADVAMATPQLYKETMKETSKTFFCSLGW